MKLRAEIILSRAVPNTTTMSRCIACLKALHVSSIGYTRTSGKYNRRLKHFFASAIVAFSRLGAQRNREAAEARARKQMCHPLVDVQLHPSGPTISSGQTVRTRQRVHVTGPVLSNQILAITKGQQNRTHFSVGSERGDPAREAGRENMDRKASRLLCQP